MKKKHIWISVAVIAAALLAIRALAQGHGFIKIDSPGVTMVLNSGWFSTQAVRSGSEPVRVKSGTHRLQTVHLEAEKGNDKWQLRSRGPFSELHTIKIENEATRTVKLGTPLTVKTDVRRRRGNISVGLSITGQAGEYYIPSVRKNGRTLPAPKVTIVDESAKVLASGKFEYG